jgi:5-formyltetrahydrofolate cyclo-ligase
MNEPRADKAAARALARARLATLTAGERAAAGREIGRRVWRLPPVGAARTLLLYASLPGEAPTDAIAHEARWRGIQVVYPRCLPETREMALHLLDDEAGLQPGLYGIREPHPACPLVALEDIDAALVPGLAWDRRGGRLGRGAGYYDRLLGAPGWRGFVCGLFFAAQELDSIPLDPWDVRMDAVVTEKEVLRIEL